MPDLRILLEDSALLVVDKPAGLLVHPAGSVQSGTLRDLAEAYLGFRPGLPHRLDRETSGVMVLCKTPAALSRFGNHFQRRLIKKRYLALVHGEVASDRCIEFPIGHNPAKTPTWDVDPEGRPARTELSALHSGTFSLVSLVPVTGRTHQLRIHCAAIGHPMVGDDWYGSKVVGPLCLHAEEIRFFHPVSNVETVVRAPRPAWAQAF